MLTVTKTVRNLTSGLGFSSSIYAYPSDTLMFMITVVNNSGQNIQNVFVRDVLPANLIYNNNLIIACTTNNGNYNNCNGGNYNYSGNITSGINLNTMYAGQTATITYQAQVAPTTSFVYGSTTLTNNVSVTSSSSGYIPTANATVIVTKSAVLGASTVSTGLTNNFWLDSFFLPLMLILVGFWMWRSGIFFGIWRWLANKKETSKISGLESL